MLAGSAEFRALNTPDKDRPDEAKEVAKLFRQLYRVRGHDNIDRYGKVCVCARERERESSAHALKLRATQSLLEHIA